MLDGFCSMGDLRRGKVYWRFALAVWMGLIFLMGGTELSAEATAEVFGSVNYLARKFAHIFEYAILTYLWLRSIRMAPQRFRSCLVWSVALAVCYAVPDEVHQNFVLQRVGTWSDVVYDTVGALVMGYTLWWIRQRGSANLRHWVLGMESDPVSDQAMVK